MSKLILFVLLCLGCINGITIDRENEVEPLNNMALTKNLSLLIAKEGEI